MSGGITHSRVEQKVEVLQEMKARRKGIKHDAGEFAEVEEEEEYEKEVEE